MAIVIERLQTPLYSTWLCGILVGMIAAMFELKSLVDMMSIGTLMAYTGMKQFLMLQLINAFTALIINSLLNLTLQPNFFVCLEVVSMCVPTPCAGALVAQFFVLLPKHRDKRHLGLNESAGHQQTEAIDGFPVTLPNRI